MWLKYSDRPILLGEQVSRDQHAPVTCYGKPNGFWITDDTEDSWRSWCISEQFDLEQLTHVHQVELDERHIKILRTLDEIAEFNWQFSVTIPFPFHDKCIDWPEVARQYDGLIITPYQWSIRLDRDYSWYYIWDCASGCIWNAAAIRAIKLLFIDNDVVKAKREDD